MSTSPAPAAFGQPDVTALALLTPEGLAACLARELRDATPEEAAIPPRDEAVAIFRRYLGRYQADVRSRFEQHVLKGTGAAKLIAAFTDVMLRSIVDLALRATGQADGLEEIVAGYRPAGRLVVAATGGYGRGLLAPFSDIDLLFLTEEDNVETAHRLVEYVLYFLWDLGVKVGHATRTISECIEEARKDTTVRTALLDARLLAGDAALFAMFEARYIVACVEAGPAGFIQDKRRERLERHRRFGDSPYLVEPNIKEGRGGLRDLQTLYWMCRNTFGTRHVTDLLAPDFIWMGILTEQEAARARRSWDFLWTVRLHLHYVAGRAEERLTFDMQPVIGARMGYTRHGRQNGVERFMRHYFLTAREVMRLTHVLEPAVLRQAQGPVATAAKPDEAMREAGFTLLDGQILPERGISFDQEPIRMMQLLDWARLRRRPLHPLARHQLIRWERRAVALRDDPEAARIFLDLLCGETTSLEPPRRRKEAAAPEGEGAAAAVPSYEQHTPPGHAHWLHILNETGIFGRLIPDWARIVGQMQFDTYHVFTVDEHTIEAVRIMDEVASGRMADEIPVAYELVKGLHSRRALYMAVLLHDIAKGRGGDHSEIGSEIAADLCPRLGMSGEETETVSWLVLHHLLLSHTAFQRDIDDPKTILDVADIVQSPERLRLLLLLTIVDMRAVSSRVWNAWKATLLRELYVRVAEVLAGGLATTERDVRVRHAKEITAEILAEDGVPESDINRFLDLGYAGYWLSFDHETHKRHARLIREADAKDAPLTVEVLPLPARGVTEVTVYTIDVPGLFSKIAGALALAGASIVDARIHTMMHGMALDTFWIQDTAGSAYEETHRLARLSSLIEQALSGQLDIGTEIARAGFGHMPLRMRAIHVPPRVVIDNGASNTYTVIEINGRDRPGLLHDVTAAMSEENLQIASAHITTYGVRAVDVFYVKDLFGLKITDKKRLDEIRDRLLSCMKAAEAEAKALLDARLSA
ncbi:[protein-PII] uridylyltransferase [Acetobacter senegalensis]|uniref:Bifunctional uridylyltransferase/uridylyl-removing enzyme n=1 Tax=Acetobacter senegalensis TaxID=446692 RepID=A0A0U5EXL7_9PROT|nr:[protein-PII] uridylyltransferase [Acetobacter senegalensis]CEF42303.1 [protein-PII] uridylyltransferase [Acetobacter senegalensis]